ncbi:MAG: nitric oxide reductase activation protein NorD [Nitrospiraceae bacterium]
MADISAQQALRARLAGELGVMAAEALVDRLAETAGMPDAAAAVLTLLDKLEAVSVKATDAAIQALPELDRRAGLSHVRPWLTLGVALAELSGATALKYFKDSPRILGIIDRPAVRTTALTIGLEMAHRDPNVTLEYLRTAPQIFAAVPFDQVKSWLEIGVDLMKSDVVIGLEFIRQIPALAPVLPLSDVRSWLSFAMCLIAPNSLGKPDYMATMEFLRSSPALLADIEQGALRAEVLSLGALLAKHSPESGVAWLAESPRLLRLLPSMDWQIRMLQYGLLLGEQDAEVTLGYLRRCPEVIGLIGDGPAAISRFETWFKTGMEVLAYSIEGARSYFTVESRTALASVERALSGVPLRQVARRVKLFVQGLCGVDVAITALPESIGSPTARATVSDDGRTIALPAVCRRFPTAEENERWYLVAAAHEAGHVEFGTYRLRLEPLADLVDAVRQRYSLGGRVMPATLAELFRLYPAPRLVQDLWIVMEDARIEYLLQAEYPGLRRELAQLAAAAITPRDPARGLTVKELIVDCLLRLSTGEPESAAVPRAVSEEVRILWDLGRSVLRPDATAEETVRLVHALYVRMEELVASRGDASTTIPKGEESQEFGAGPTPSNPANVAYHPITNWGYRGTMNPEFIARNREPVETGDRQLEAGRLHGQDDGARAGSDAGHATKRGERMVSDEGVLGGGQSLPSRVEELLALDLVERAMPKTPASGERAVRYPEWDHRIQDYRMNWCRVVERPAEAGSDECVDRTLTARRSTVKSLRRFFEALRPLAFRRVVGQADGEELDIDALVRRAAELHAGLQTSDRLFIRREKKEREVAVAFLVDVSGSTSRQLESGQRVIEIEKESLVLLCESLEAVGDHYGLYAYSGQGRADVEFLTIKDFDNRLGATTAHRLGGLGPRGQNRDGAAIRHASAKLQARGEKTRLLIILSDGRPLDDEYKDEYALEDTKAALREARHGGIDTFCVTIDREADHYVRRMYGDAQFTVIDRVESLPSRLPRIYQRLTS